MTANGKYPYYHWSRRLATRPKLRLACAATSARHNELGASTPKVAVPMFVRRWDFPAMRPRNSPALSHCSIVLCIPALRTSYAGHANRKRTRPHLQPTPAAHRQSSGVHNIEADARGSRDQALAFAQQLAQKNRHNASSSTLPLPSPCSPNRAVQTAATPAGTCTRSTQAASTYAGRNASRHRPGAIASSSIHK